MGEGLDAEKDSRIESADSSRAEAVTKNSYNLADLVKSDERGRG